MPTLSGSSKSVNPQSNFEELFHDYVSNGVQAALDRIDPDPNVPLGGEERERVLHVLSYSLNVPNAWQKTYELLQVMNPKMERAGQWQDWRTVLQQAVRVSQSTQDLTALADLTVQLGYFCTRMGDFAAATHWLMQSVEQCRKIDNPSLLALGLARLADLARLQSHYEKAKDYIAEALPLVGDDDDKRSRCFSVLGAIARDTQDHQLAELYSRQALDLRRGHQDKRALAFCLNDLGETLRWQKAYDDAIQCYKEALEIYAYTHDAIREAVTRMNLGIIYSLSDRPQKALEAYAKAEKVLLDVCDRTHLAMLYNNQGIEFFNLAQWDEAERAHQKSFNLWSMLDKPDAMINVLDGIGLARMGNGAFDESIKIFEFAVNLLERLENDSLITFYKRELMTHLEQARSELARQREKDGIVDAL